MLSLLVPILVNYLLQHPYDKSQNKYSLSLHAVSLEKLMKIGPTYPEVLQLSFQCGIATNNVKCFVRNLLFLIFHVIV